MKKLFYSLTFLFSMVPLDGGIFLNEISAGGPSDWIELKVSPDTSCMEISSLFVTMYYGTNERVALSPVTLYGTDRPDTPWDDRFAVVHFTDSQAADETDADGDMNHNGTRDLYCRNFGLWNTDCCVSIDSDDDPANNGILDFMAFSNRDGSPNSTIESYIKSAVKFSMWESSPSANIQDCCIFTGPDGTNSYSTISRLGFGDTNSMNDFVVTPYATPGADNITLNLQGKGRVLCVLKKTVTCDMTHPSGMKVINLPFFLYGKTSMRVRIFNSSGMVVYSGPLIADLDPGFYTVRIDPRELKGKVMTGLYPVCIEAVNSETGRSASLRVKLVIIRKR